MDGWMEGEMNGWMDGWMEGWREGEMDGWLDEWMVSCVLPLCTKLRNRRIRHSESNDSKQAPYHYGTVVTEVGLKG
jgi:hypothetical protein